LGKEAILKKLNRELKKNKIKDDDIVSIEFLQVERHDFTTGPFTVTTDHLSVFYKIPK